MTDLKTKQELARLLEEKQKRQRYEKLSTLFPDHGPYRRELYKKHIEFIQAGSTYLQRAFIAANRTGKTVTGAYEMAVHLTGLYPTWWEGRRYEDPVSAWAASVSNEATKNIIQKELLGESFDIGSGLIPQRLIQRVVKKPGVADAIETVYVSHVSGGTSRLDFKSYEQGRDTFQGTKKQVIWLDEEPTDPGIFSECLTRTMDKENPGIIFCTFTPLFGLSEVVLSFLPDGRFPESGVDPKSPHKYVTQVGWEEVPHLDEQQKKEILASYAPHERDARSKGIPSLGSGAIYPHSEDMLLVEPFPIPAWWPRAYGMDVGWNRTAVIWGAIDPDSKQIFLYSEHYVGQAVPAVHASAIKARGAWIWGAIDPRSDARNQADGTRLIDIYDEEGLNLIAAENSVESGIWKVNQLMESGQLKVFNTLSNWISEFRIYRRDENGKVVKKNDHIMDAMRYLIVSGLDMAQTAPNSSEDESTGSRGEGGGRSQVTGY